MKIPLNHPFLSLTDALLIYFLGFAIGSSTALIWKKHWLTTPSDKAPAQTITAKK